MNKKRRLHSKLLLITTYSDLCVSSALALLYLAIHKNGFWIGGDLLMAGDDDRAGQSVEISPGDEPHGFIITVLVVRAW